MDRKDAYLFAHMTTFAERRIRSARKAQAYEVRASLIAAMSPIIRIMRRLFKKGSVMPQKSR